MDEDFIDKRFNRPTQWKGPNSLQRFNNHLRHQLISYGVFRPF